MHISPEKEYNCELSILTTDGGLEYLKWEDTYIIRYHHPGAYFPKNMSYGFLMNYYDGRSDKDPISGGASFIKETQTGGEIYNFSPYEKNKAIKLLAFSKKEILLNQH